jgi:hypothetical protein
MRIWVSTLMILALAMAVFVGPAGVVVAQESQQIQPIGQAVACGGQRGQDRAICVTPVITLYANLTGAPQNVTGNIVTDISSCSVRINGGVGGPHIFPSLPNATAEVGFTVTVPAGTSLTANCITTANKNACRWSYTRQELRIETRFRSESVK